LTNEEFESCNSLQIAEKMDDGSSDIILPQIKQDLTRVLPPFNEDIYGFGKWVARLVQLAHIVYLN